MFQNITGENLQDEQEDVDVNSKTSKMDRAKKLFSIQNILIYAIAFMVSMVSFNGMAPFAAAIFAAVLSNRIAAGVTYIVCFFRNIFKFWNPWSITIYFNYSNLYCLNPYFQTTI